MTDNAPTVLLRSEDSGGQVAIVALTGGGRPPLHRHDFDEAFYVLEGELTFQLGDDLFTCSAGELAFAPRGIAHTYANLSGALARALLVITPADVTAEDGDLVVALAIDATGAPELSVHRAGKPSRSVPAKSAKVPEIAELRTTIPELPRSWRRSFSWRATTRSRIRRSCSSSSDDIRGSGTRPECDPGDVPGVTSPSDAAGRRLPTR